MIDAGQGDILDFLNLLLECERAGATSLRLLLTEAEAPLALSGLLSDEARYCAGLTRQIVRLGGTPSRRTGDFVEKLVATEGLAARLDLLARGQHWVARKIAQRLPALDDRELRAFLAEMHATHLVNVEVARVLMG